MRELLRRCTRCGFPAYRFQPCPICALLERAQ